MLDRDESDDCFDIDCQKDVDKNSLKIISNKLRKEGYIKGKTEEESHQMQTGFNHGFHKGFCIGKIAGTMYYSQRSQIHHESSDCVQENEQEQRNFLFEDIPQSYGVDDSILIQMQTYAIDLNTKNNSQHKIDINELTNFVTTTTELVIPPS